MGLFLCEPLGRSEGCCSWLCEPLGRSEGCGSFFV